MITTKPTHLSLFIFSFSLFVGLLACTAPTTESLPVQSPASAEPETPATVAVATATTPTPATPQSAEEDVAQINGVCQTVLNQANLRTKFGLRSISQLTFAGEMEAVIQGFGTRPTPTPSPTPAGPTPTPAPPTPTAEYIPPPPDAQGDLVHSSHYQFKILHWDLSGGGTPTQQEPSFSPPLNTPCGEQSCQQAVISQSPDGSWQLHHIWSADEDLEGVWLVSASKVQRLADLVPAQSEWGWAADNTLLWYWRDAPGYGSTQEMLVVDLTTLTVSRPQVDDSPANPNLYHHAFSPVDKTLLASPSIPGSKAIWPQPPLATFDLTQDPGLTNPTNKITPRLARVEWNEASNTYLLAIIEDDGLYLTTPDQHLTLHLPLNLWETIFEGLANGNADLTTFIPPSRIAVAASGQAVLFSPGKGQVYHIGCTID